MEKSNGCRRITSSDEGQSNLYSFQSFKVVEDAVIAELNGLDFRRVAKDFIPDFNILGKTLLAGEEYICADAEEMRAIRLTSGAIILKFKA